MAMGAGRLVALPPRLRQLLVFVVPASVLAADVCLSDAIPAAIRKEINYEGVQMPLGVWPLSWDSPKLTAWVMAILAEEKLGLNVSFGPGGAYSYTAINSLVGCSDSTDTDGCLGAPPTEPTTWHVSFETWGNAEPVYKKWFAAKKHITPIRIGNMGYLGAEGSFIRPESMEEALQTEGMPLDWFRNYNASWGDPAKYFTPIAHIPTNQLVTCLEKVQNGFLEQYYNNFQYGVSKNGKDYTPECPENGVWWLSPMCKDDETKCLPYVADPNDYNTDTIMQQAVHWNMPIAIATAKDAASFKSIAKNNKVMLYTWVPDATFVDLDLTEVIFPRYSFVQWEEGLKVTNHDVAILSKWAAVGLERASPEAYAVASKIAFPSEDINSMLAQLNAGLTERAAACEWLKANEARWSAWLPDPNSMDCLVGQGLMDADGQPLPNSTGADGCGWCPPGRASQTNADGERYCAECGAGSFQANPGQADCDTCPAGKFSGSEGQTTCMDCAIGAFSDSAGNSECTTCTKAHETTPYRGALSKWECVCDADHYRLPAHSEADGKHEPCISCPEGMECSLGNDLPVLLAGYWASGYDNAQGNFSVYACRDWQECPGGPAGTCASGRHGIACANCMADHTVGEKGTCEKCDGASALPIIIIALAALAAMAALAVYAQKDVTKTQMNTVVVGIVFGQMIMVMQIFSVFSQIQVEWIEPFRSILQAVSVLSFSNELGDISCMVPDTQSIAKYVFKLMVFPGCVVLLCATFLCMKAAGRDVSFDRAFNSIGLLTLILFLTLTMMAVQPFYCARSPNGMMTLQSDPSVICFEDGAWTGLAVLGAIAMLVYGIGVFAWVCVTTMRYPKMIACGRGSTVMNRYRFLFQRFTVECYYYAPVYLARSLMIVLLPIIFPDYGHRQVFFLALVVCSFGFLQAWIRPWRGWLPNILDAIIAACTGMVMLCAAFLLDVDEEAMRSDLKVFLMATMGVAIGSILLTVLYLAAQRLFPTKGFAAFLCHHKVGCAAGARLMKLELERRLKAQVFLDSDALDDLEDLLNIVRSQIRCLVVLLTAQTLSRPWCAGEIVMAFLNGVSMIPVKYDDYTELEVEDLQEERIASRWSIEAFAGCATQGVSLADVSKAYAHLRDLEKVSCLRVGGCVCGDPQAASRTAVEELVDRIADTKSRGVSKERVGAGRVSSKPSAESEGKVDLAVVADRTNAEAISTVAVLAHLVRKQTQWATKDLLCSGDVDLLVARGAKPDCMVVLFTDGALTSDEFPKTLLSVSDAWGDRMNIITVMMERFVFPSNEAVKSSIVPQVAKMLTRDEAEVSKVYNRMTSLLAVPFSPSGKITVLEVEVANIVRRLSRATLSSSATSNLTASNSGNGVSTSRRSDRGNSLAVPGSSEVKTTGDATAVGKSVEKEADDDAGLEV